MYRHVHALNHVLSTFVIIKTYPYHCHVLKPVPLQSSDRFLRVFPVASHQQCVQPRDHTVVELGPQSWQGPAIIPATTKGLKKRSKKKGGSNKNRSLQL